MPTLADQHAAIRTWAVADLGISDSDQIAEILSIYDSVMTRYAPRFVVNSDAGAEGQATAAFIYKSTHYHWRDEDASEQTIIAYRADNRHIVFRRQALATPRLRALSDIALASAVMQKDFGYTEDGGHGAYIQSSSNYPDLWHHKIKLLRQAYVRNIRTSFMERIIDFVTFHYRQGKGTDRWMHALAVDMTPSKRLPSFLWRMAHLSFNHGLRQLLGHLDQGALRAMGRARLPCTTAYEWLSGYTEDFSWSKTKISLASDDVCRRRQAAFAAQPALAWLMIGSGWKNRQVTQAIDDGKPLPEAIRTAYDDKDVPLITREVLTWLRDKNHRFIDGYKPELNPGMYHFYSDLPWLAKVPREWRPRQAEELSTLDSVRYLLFQYEKVTSRPNDTLLHEFMAACRNPAGVPKGLWGDKTLTGMDMWQVIGHFNEGRTLDLTAHHRDFFGRVGTQIILPAIFNAAAQAGMSEQVFGDEKTYQEFSPLNKGKHFAGDLSAKIYTGLSVLKIISLSDRWHRQVNRMDARTNTLNKNAAWVPLFAPMTLPNGVLAECLVSTDALRAEGSRLGHCVGGYTHQCVIGKSHIVSLRDGQGAWATTLELVEVIEGRDRRVAIKQHEGRKGVTMSMLRAAQDAAQAVLDFVNKSKPDWAAIDACREKYRADELLIKVGFDYRDAQACDDAYGAWHGAFGDLFPDATRADYLERTGIAPAIRAHFKM